MSKAKTSKSKIDQFFKSNKPSNKSEKKEEN